MESYLLQTIASIIALIMLYVAKFLSRKLIMKYGRFTHKPEARMNHMNRIISILLNLSFIIVLAIIWGVEPDNLLVGLSSIFAVIGIAFFAQWSLLSNVTAGIIIFFTAPYRVGDRVKIIDKDVPIEARIEAIFTFYTHLRTAEDDELVAIPNNMFLQKAVLLCKNDTDHQ